MGAQGTFLNLCTFLVFNWVTWVLLPQVRLDKGGPQPLTITGFLGALLFHLFGDRGGLWDQIPVIVLVFFGCSWSISGARWM